MKECVCSNDELAAGDGRGIGWWWQRPAAGVGDGKIDRRLSAGGGGHQRWSGMGPVQVFGR